VDKEIGVSGTGGQEPSYDTFNVLDFIVVVAIRDIEFALRNPNNRANHYQQRDQDDAKT
jgi:hypothetical protein